mgnify:CR=1 FL=1
MKIETGGLVCDKGDNKLIFRKNDVTSSFCDWILMKYLNGEELWKI